MIKGEEFNDLDSKMALVRILKRLVEWVRGSLLSLVRMGLFPELFYCNFKESDFLPVVLSITGDSHVIMKNEMEWVSLGS